MFFFLKEIVHGYKHYSLIITDIIHNIIRTNLKKKLQDL